jgi:hypothetical protein
MTNIFHVDRSSSSADGQDVRIRMDRKPPEATTTETGTSSPVSASGIENPPELPPRLPGGGRASIDATGMRLTSNSNFELCSSQQELEQCKLIKFNYI